MEKTINQAVVPPYPAKGIPRAANTISITIVAAHSVPIITAMITAKDVCLTLIHGGTASTKGT